MYGASTLGVLKIGYSNPSWSWKKNSQSLSEKSKHPSLALEVHVPRILIFLGSK